MKKMTLLLATLSTSGAMAMNVSHYGFVKGSYLKTNKELTATNGTTNADHKPFTVGDTTTYTKLQKEGRGQFSVKQSRWGMKANNGSKMSAQLEFDLDGQSGNANGAANSATGIIRVRQVNLSYNMLENGTLTFGKKWTKFAGLLPHTYSTTMVGFFAGNTGFLVDGADYTHKFGAVSVSAELHNSGDNTTTKLSTPIMGLTVDYKADGFRIGAAYTRADLDHKVQNETTNQDSEASGMKLYASTSLVKNLDFRAEYYMGENLGSIHTGGLTSAVTTDAKKYEEAGYFASLKYTLMDKYGIFAGYSNAEWDKAEEAGSNALSANSITRFGLDAKLDKNMTVFVEYQGFKSTWNQTVASTTKDSKGSLIDLGFMYKF